MEDLLIVLLLILASIGAVEVADCFIGWFLPLLAKEKPLELWLTGQGAEYKLRRAVHQARHQNLHKLTVVCLDEEATKICRLIELANPDIEFVYGDSICAKCG